MTTVLPAVLALVGVVFTATWTVVGYSHRFRARRSIQSEIELWRALPKGEAEEALRRHLNARIHVYIDESCDATRDLSPWKWVMALGGLLFVLGGLALLRPEISHGSLGRVSVFVGLVVGLVGLVLILGGRTEQGNATALAKKVEALKGTDTTTPQA